MKKLCPISVSPSLNGKQTRIYRSLTQAQQSSTQITTAVHIANLTGLSYPETLYQLKQMELMGLVRRSVCYQDPSAKLDPAISWHLKQPLTPNHEHEQETIIP